MFGTRYAAEQLHDIARCDQPIGTDVGTEIDIHVTAQTQNGAVTFAGNLDLAVHLSGMVYRGQMLSAVLDLHNGTPDIPRGKRDQKILGVELATRSEPATDIVLNQVDRSFRKTHHLGDGAAVEERHLCSPFDR
jgi:hypothetical protein